MSNLQKREAWTILLTRTFVDRIIHGQYDGLIPDAKVNGIPLYKITKFYKALDEILCGFHQQLLITNKHVYINEFRYFARCKIHVSYEDITTDTMKQYEAVVELDDNCQQNLQVLTYDLGCILHRARQFGDSPFSPIYL